LKAIATNASSKDIKLMHVRINQNKTTDNNEDIEQSGARFKETVETVASKVIVRKEAVGSNKRTRAKDLKDTRCQTKWLI
jgi:hypothetical protein